MILVLLGIAIASLGAWALDRRHWKRPPEWVYVPLWFVPVTLFIAFGLMASGVYVGGKQVEAGNALLRVLAPTCDAIDGVVGLDTAVVGFLRQVAP